jgi:hypothetical protein
MSNAIALNCIVSYTLCLLLTSNDSEQMVQVMVLKIAAPQSASLNTEMQ